ncbi:MAG: hypothetical protein COV45_02710 [Deltaproteobacteria bacterium CG11_big_fil_rev_8_21_14_0_20_47_16]|nr:MAG: hypothetical protein COV45_02710 [Deltaproteobacteria bacterium CG11_big_fil_rev_8_21_14_0_20_47_16]
MMHIDIAKLLDDASVRHPNKLALAAGEQQLTFCELRNMSQRLAATFMSAGLTGERVATLLPNSPELIVCYLACWTAGVTMVPFEYIDAPPEILTGIQDCKPKWLIVHPERLDEVSKMDLSKTSIQKTVHDFSTLLTTPPQTLPPPSPDTLAFILYTSGSTALPKGVTHSHTSASGIIASVLSALNKVDNKTSMVIHDSVSHMGGWIEAFPLLYCGATIILDRDFDVAHYYKQLRKWRPSVTSAHVHQLWEIVQFPQAHREDFASINTVFSGGDEMPIPLQRDFMTLTGLPIQTGWGMTEAIWLTIAREPNLQQRGFLGKPVDKVQLRIVDKAGYDLPKGESGEIWVKGPMVTPGYWNRPEINRAILVDGWLHTGDTGLQDNSGNYWFTGRVKQIIERSSENITPGEIEQALCRHPAVAEAIAFGIPDPKEGQVPIAYICLKPGQAVSEDDLKSFLATQIADFKIPVKVLTIDSMPLLPSGKIDRKTLAQNYDRTASN